MPAAPLFPSPRPMSPRTRLVVAVLLGLSVLAVGFLVSPQWQLRNRGADTSCPAYLRMSAAKQVRVLEKAGYSNPNMRWLASDTADHCRAARHTSDQDDSIDIIDGP